tara:strand:- start:213 stop:650 length:438 start_codon:yes stop_codon:yes gene_type:complete
MSNGNVFVNMSAGQGGAGYMYEADSMGNVVWLYNTEGTPKAFRYECKDLGIIALLDNPCALDDTAIDETNLSKVVVSPNPSNGVFSINGIGSSKYSVTVVNAFGQLIKKQTTAQIDLTDCANGLYFINIVNENGFSTLRSVSITK